MMTGSHLLITGFIGMISLHLAQLLQAPDHRGHKIATDGLLSLCKSWITVVTEIAMDGLLFLSQISTVYPHVVA